MFIMWVVFDKQTVTARVPATEWEAVNSIDGEDSPVDALQAIIDTVVAEVRAAIAACTKNTLDPDVRKIPLSLVNDACSLVVYYFASRAAGAGTILVQDARYQAWAKARDVLDRVRTCEICIEHPSTGVVSGSGSSSAQIAVRTPTRFDRSRWRGA